MRRIGLGTILAAAAGASITVAVLPPVAGAAGSRDPAADLVRVAYHVHTTRSDGTGTRAEVAAAARRAGIDVVIVTDHGDGTRASDAPAYIDGVLMIDGVEVSTWAGHYVALGASASPYPLGGEPRSVVEDIRRLGGFGIAAHPGSSKDGLRWRDWDAPIDAIEWLNADSEWRDRPGALWRGVLAYPWRPVEAVAALIDRPAFELAQWDRLAGARRVPGLAAHDAHARLGLRGVGEPYDGWIAFEAPSYAATFGAFANVVRLAAPLANSATADAAAVLHAIREGRTYAVITGIAAPGRFAFTAESAGRSASIGGQLTPEGPVRLRVDAEAPAGAVTVLVCDGVQVAESAGGTLEWEARRPPGACRAEVRVRRGARAALWLVANPIYVWPVLPAPAAAEATTATVVIPLAGSVTAGAWTSEVRAGSVADVDAVTTAEVEPAVRFRWRLGQAADDAPFSAMRLDTPEDFGQFDRVVVRGRADRPMRVWIQLRVPGGAGQRWGRSVYFDTHPREVTVPFATMLPLGGADRSRPPVEDVSALLVVVDTVHAIAGSEGVLTLQELQLAR